jgi:hypothetical protein
MLPLAASGHSLLAFAAFLPTRGACVGSAARVALQIRFRQTLAIGSSLSKVVAPKSYDCDRVLQTARLRA